MQDVCSEDRQQEFMVLRSEAALQVLLQGRGEKSYSLDLWNMVVSKACFVGVHVPKVTKFESVLKSISFWYMGAKVAREKYIRNGR